MCASERIFFTSSSMIRAVSSLNSLYKLEPVMLKKGTTAPPATARVKRIFPALLPTCVIPIPDPSSQG